MSTESTPRKQIVEQIDAIFSQGTGENDTPADILLCLMTQYIMQLALEKDVEDYLSRVSALGPAGTQGIRHDYTTETVHVASGDVVVQVPVVHARAMLYRSPVMEFLGEYPEQIESLAAHACAREVTVNDVQAAFRDPQSGRVSLPDHMVTAIADQLRLDHQRFSQRDLEKCGAEQVYLETVFEHLRSSDPAENDVLCAWASRRDGRRMLLHVSEGKRRSVEAWRDLIGDVQARGLPPPIFFYMPNVPQILSAVSQAYPKSARQRYERLLILIATVAALILSFGGVESIPRQVVVFGFLLLAPGIAFVRLLKLGNPITELSFSVLLSLTINTIVSEALVLIRIWNPMLGMAIVAALTLCGLVLEEVPNRRHKASNYDGVWYKV